MLAQDNLKQLTDNKQVAALRFGETLWLLDSRAALYWPEQDSLLLADLHFEKGSYLSQYASPVPRYDSRATLNTIAALINTYQPHRVLCLGDSFHDINAFERLIPEDVLYLQEVIGRVDDWIWLVGNHDPEIPSQLGGARVERYELITADGVLITCQHIPDTSADLQIVGHYHPKAYFTVGKRRFRGKSLITTEKRMVMPALGQYTGGLNIDDEVLMALAPKQHRRCFVICEQRVVALPKGR